MAFPVSQEAAEEISRLMEIFTHPVRVQLANALAVDGPASPSVLADRFDLTVGDSNYHLGTLRTGGVAHIVRSRKVRGAKERTYQMRPRSSWPFKPRLYPLITYMIPATSSGPDEPFLISLGVSLDARGVADATAAISSTREKAAQIEASAESRLLEAGPVANPIRAELCTGLLDAAVFNGAISSAQSGRPADG